MLQFLTCAMGEAEWGLETSWIPIRRPRVIAGGFWTAFPKCVLAVCSEIISNWQTPLGIFWLAFMEVTCFFLSFPKQQEINLYVLLQMPVLRSEYMLESCKFSHGSWSMKLGEGRLRSIPNVSSEGTECHSPDFHPTPVLSSSMSELDKTWRSWIPAANCFNCFSGLHRRSQREAPPSWA